MVQLENKQALIVEGDAHSLAVISSLLRDLGIGFKRNTSGMSVIEQLRVMQPRPDFILLNIELPVGDGTMIGKAIRADRHLSSIPIILIGAHSIDPLALNIPKNDFAGYITKPLPRKAFGDIIRRVLSGEHVWEIAV